MGPTSARHAPVHAACWQDAGHRAVQQRARTCSRSAPLIAPSRGRWSQSVGATAEISTSASTCMQPTGVGRVSSQMRRRRQGRLGSVQTSQVLFLSYLVRVKRSERCRVRSASCSAASGQKDRAARSWLSPPTRLAAHLMCPSAAAASVAGAAPAARHRLLSTALQGHGSRREAGPCAGESLATAIHAGRCQEMSTQSSLAGPNYESVQQEIACRVREDLKSDRPQPGLSMATIGSPSRAASLLSASASICGRKAVRGTVSGKRQSSQSWRHRTTQSARRSPASGGGGGGDAAHMARGYSVHIQNRRLCAIVQRGAVDPESQHPAIAKCEQLQAASTRCPSHVGAIR